MGVSLINRLGYEYAKAFKECVSSEPFDLNEYMLYSIETIQPKTFKDDNTLKSVTIPKNVTSIGNEAFRNCSSLTSVTIKNGSIGNYAFGICYNLSSLTLEQGVTSIGGFAFYSAGKIQTLTIPNSVTNIGEYCFGNCNNLESVILGDGVTSISYDAFLDCSSLVNVTIHATTPPTLGSSAFQNTSPNLVIYVPAESVDAYKTATEWSGYASKIQAIPDN